MEFRRVLFRSATRWKKTERYNLIFRYPKDSEPILAVRPADMQSAHASDARQARPLPPQFDKRTYSRSGSRLQEPRQLARASPERSRGLASLGQRHGPGEGGDDEGCERLRIRIVRGSGQSSGGPLGAKPFGDCAPPGVEDLLDRDPEVRVREREFYREVAERTAQHRPAAVQVARDLPENGRYAVPRRRGRSDRLDPGLLAGLRDPLADDRQGKVLLRGEMVVQRAARHSGVDRKSTRLNSSH